MALTRLSNIYFLWKAPTTSWYVDALYLPNEVSNEFVSNEHRVTLILRDRSVAQHPPPCWRSSSPSWMLSYIRHHDTDEICCSMLACRQLSDDRWPINRRWNEQVWWCSTFYARNWYTTMAPYMKLKGKTYQKLDSLTVCDRHR